MAEKYKIDNKTEVLCQDLTYGFLLQVEKAEVEDSKLNIIVNGTDLSEDEVLNLRNHQVDEMYNIILKLTYPHLYDEKGNFINIDEEETKPSKKKA